MLGKLMKNELKATYKPMLLIYGLLILVSVLMTAVFKFNIDGFMAGVGEKSDVFGMILSFLMMTLFFIYFILSIVSVTAMYFYAIKRFKNRLLENENTVNYKPCWEIVAKCVVSSMWTLIGFVAVLISYCIIIFGSLRSEFYVAFSEMVKVLEIGDKFKPENIMFFIELALLGGVLVVISIVLEYLHIYASMAVGYSFKTHKGLKSIGIYILIDLAASNLEIVFINLFSLNESLLSNWYMVFMVSIVITIVEAAIYFAIANYYIKKSLKYEINSSDVDS